MANHVTHDSELARLNDTDLILTDDHQDIRGCKVVDGHGNEIGRIDDLFIDVAEKRMRMLQIRAGGFLGLGERHFLLPVDAVTSVTDSVVHVNVTLEHVVGSPAYDPRLEVAPLPMTWGPYYGYYELAPFWNPGYLYPEFPINGGPSGAPSGRSVDHR
jgi:sporulation protein YlmC with PRC-barrel domain